MRFRFIGKYTNGHTCVSIRGVVFEGHDPVSVDDDDIALKLLSHPEVEEVADKPVIIEASKIEDPVAAHEPPVAPAPARRRGRPRK